MGEPLLAEVTALNTSDKEVLIRTDADGPKRFLIAADGTRTPLVPPTHVGDWAYFSEKIAVGAKTTLHFVVPEIADVKRAGKYRLVMEYEELNASGELSFVVKPYDREALRARASQLYQSAASASRSYQPPEVRKPDYGLGDAALATIDPAIAKSFLCDLMKLNRPTAAAERLEHIGDEESIRCLAGALSAAQGDWRDALTGSLSRLLRALPDGPSKESIEKALEQQPAR
jgi:hypothetical protein